MSDDDAEILKSVAAGFESAAPARLGVAVSGGGDSVALLHLLRRCFASEQTAILAVTVDHGLRPESAAEADTVARFAAQIGVQHTTLRWQRKQGTGNLQGAARAGRYRLMAEWARENHIALLAVGHTVDDQAETVMMRLARASGVDGLSAIPRRRVMHGITILRPVLDLTRATLRAYLHRHALPFVDDPSNSDMRYERVRMRSLLSESAHLGLTAETLGEVADNMASAREALDWYSFLAARDTATIYGGDVCIDMRKFRTLPEEIARRLLLRAVMWVGGGVYPPRRKPLADALAAVRGGRAVTLNGCRVMRHTGSIWVFREYNAVRNLRRPVTEIWDRRWGISVPRAEAPGLQVAAMGRSGMAQCPDWKGYGRPHAAMIASPAIWRGDDLVAAPLARHDTGFSVWLLGGEEEFYASILSH